MERFSLEWHQLLSRAPIIAWVGTLSTRVDEGRKCSILLGIKTQGEYRTVMGRGEKSLLRDPGSKLRQEESRTRRAKIFNGMERKQKQKVGEAEVIAFELFWARLQRYLREVCMSTCTLQVYGVYKCTLWDRQTKKSDRGCVMPCPCQNVECRV